MKKNMYEEIKHVKKQFVYDRYSKIVEDFNSKTKEVSHFLSEGNRSL